MSPIPDVATVWKSRIKTVVIKARAVSSATTSFVSLLLPHIANAEIFISRPPGFILPRREDKNRTSTVDVEPYWLAAEHGEPTRATFADRQQFSESHQAVIPFWYRKGKWILNILKGYEADSSEKTELIWRSVLIYLLEKSYRKPPQEQQIRVRRVKTSSFLYRSEVLHLSPQGKRHSG
jgi:hypothetical protein